MSVRTELERSLPLIEGRRAGAMDRSALRQLPALYRGAVAELAEARARGLPRRELEALEARAARSRAVVRARAAAARPRRARSARRLPAATSRSSRELALATALLVAGTALGYLEVERDRSSAALLLPGGLRENAEESFRAPRDARAGDPVYGAFYFTNNARVAFYAYALGGTCGIGTALVLLFNGAILGATFAVVSDVGFRAAFWSFVLPHGGLELFAILAAAAGGLHMARGLLQPGWSRRRESFGRAARESLPLALGAALLLALAGLVEGWISPKPLPMGSKAAIGIGLDLLPLAYLVRAERLELAAERESAVALGAARHSLSRIWPPRRRCRRLPPA